MYNSELVGKNEEYIKDAINNGIDSNTINNTLEKVASYNGSSNQVIQVVETIASMKSNDKTIRDERYLTELVKDNNSKIKSALNDGISPMEIANTLIDSLENKKDININFLVRLICEMKKQEIKLKNNNNQKQFIKE